MNLSFRLISKIGLLLVIFGFFMPIACERNGFQIAKFMMDTDNNLAGMLIYLLFACALVGTAIGAMLLTNKSVNPSIDWAVIILCIVSGLIVYFKNLDGLKLQNGAYVILVGWIVALGAQILAKLKGEV